VEASEAPQEATEPETPETEGAEEEASPPDVGESLQQMNERLEQMASRLPEGEQEDDVFSQLMADPYGDETEEQQQQEQYGDEQQSGEDDTAQLQQLIGEAAEAAVMPYFAQMEARARETAIRSYAEQHPDLKGDVLDSVAADIEELGLQPKDGMPPDPRIVEKFHKAYIAEAAASGGETPAESGSGEGATLETGAGPGAPETEVDPVEQRWMDAIKGSENRSAFD
jgi:hypothetical protein